MIDIACNEATVELVDIEAVGEEDRKALTDRELKTLEGFRIKKRRDEWLAGHLAVKRAFIRHAGYESGLGFRDLEVCYLRSGKPVLYVRGERSEYGISISHSHRWAIGGVSSDNIGIDIELIEPKSRTVEEIVLCEEELEILNAAQDRNKAFTQLWSAKEAFVKALGIGLMVNFHDIRVLDLMENRVILDGGTVESSAFGEYLISLCVLKEITPYPSSHSLHPLSALRASS